MSDTPETMQASAAVAILSRQFVERFQLEMESLAKVAFETDKLDPADGWRYDAFRAVFVKQPVEPVEAAPTDGAEA